MASTQDSKKAKLLTALSKSSGNVTDLWKEWLEANTTGSAPTVSGLESLFLDEEGIGAGHIDNRWLEWLGAAPRSLTGTLQQRWQDYWES